LNFGHISKELNPKMVPYLKYPRLTIGGYDIIDQNEIINFLIISGRIIEKIARKGGKILFVATAKQNFSLVKYHAIRSNSYYITSRWLGGMITNWLTIKKKLKQLLFLENLEEKKLLKLFSKKEASIKKKKLEKLRNLFTGIKHMEKRPDFVIFTNQFQEKRAISECLSLGIPCACIVDTNCDPSIIPFPILGNDDNSGSINFILNFIANSIISGTKAKIEDEKKLLEKVKTKNEKLKTDHT
jgi:small subunit ribosomal protein S2